MWRWRAARAPTPGPASRVAPATLVAPAWSPGRYLVLAAMVVAAVAVRLWHIRVGLPDFVEEAIPFRRALAMWGWESGQTDLNPHFFHYPTLSLYLHHLLQRAHVAWGLVSGQFASANDYYLLYRLDPSPMVVLARLLGVAADAATLVGVAVIGERIRRGAGLLAAALVAFAPVMIQTSRAVQADPLMTAFAVWGLERMLVYRDRGGIPRLIGAVALVGLAAGTKYTAALMLVPLAWVLVERHRRRAIPIGAAAFASAALVALITSPFILVELPTFFRDLAFVSQLPVAGHLGNLEDRAFLYHLAQLGGDLGWVAVLLLGVSLAALALRRPERGGVIVLWLALLAFAVPISLARIEAARYRVPVIPIAALLIGVAARSLAGPDGGGWRRPVRLALPAALLLPALAAGVRSGAAGSDSTQLEARRWCEQRLSENELLVQEAYGVHLPGLADAEHARDERPVRLASAPVRARFLARRGFRVVTLPLSVAGRCISRVQLPAAAPVELEIFPHTADFNRIFYDPRLLIGVDYLLTSEAVRGRFEADPGRFAAANRFYRLLDADAEVAARFRPRPGVVGPGITVYRLGARMDSLIVARHGRLDPFWWTASIPATYRTQVEALLRASGETQVLGEPDAEGRPASWVVSLAEVFEERIHGFGSRMADELTSLDRCDPARRHAAANLAMAPDHLEDCLAFTACSGRLGHWQESRAVVERAIAATGPAKKAIPYLRLEHARILVKMGEIHRAREELMRVLEDEGVDLSLTEAARHGLKTIE